ncbi:MAG: putative hydrolase YxeP [Chlamydiae bacterium]|nr:putative hydrolase YxeP [Chlamydiota bacterium]
MNDKELLELAVESQEYITPLRHALHEIPELGWQEEKTISLIQSEIREIARTSDVKMSYQEKEGGLWVDLTFHPEKERILYRADIDALPIEEQTGLPFSSNHPGVMHACGHDCHSAMLLGALKLFASGKFTPHYNLRLVWQRAEEVGTIQSGASKLVEEGVVEGISHCYGLHISSTESYGTFISRPNYLMCRAGHLHIEVDCLGGHVMRPELGSNAIDIISEIHMALKGFELRKLGPNEIISFVPSISRAGSGCNIRPDHGEMWYAIHNFLPEERLDDFISSIKTRIGLIIQSYPDASLSKFHYHPGYPPLINDPDNTQFVKNLLDQHFETRKISFMFSGEDFSYYLQNRIGSYWLLGARKGEQTDHHTSGFNPDESVLWQGVAFWLLLSSKPYGLKLSGSKEALAWA